MATSKCTSCGSTFFEVVTKEPARSKYKLNFVQCSGCGGVVGVMEYFNSGAILNQHSAAIKKIARAVGASVEL